jgi:molybdopterin converting factor small subunit
MRALIGQPECVVHAGAPLSDLIEIYEERLKNEPMIKMLKERTGKTQLIFIVNGRVIKENEAHTLTLKDGDDVRIHHPYFGG